MQVRAFERYIPLNDVPKQQVVSHKQLGHIYLNVAIGKPILILSKKKLGHDLFFSDC